MFNSDPHPRPAIPPATDRNADWGYTGRVAKTLALFFGVLFLIGIIIGWFLFHPPLLDDVVQR